MVMREVLVEFLEIRALEAGHSCSGSRPFVLWKQASSENLRTYTYMPDDTRR